MSSTRIPTRPEMGRSIIQHDPRSRRFGVAALLDPNTGRVSKTWRRGGPYDQGQTSSCVGQAMRGLLTTTPFAARLPLATRRGLDALAIYSGAQRYDEWPGEDYDGTSALGACKYLQTAGLITAYHWCFGHDDVIDTLAQHGPVAIGVRWTEGMMNTDGRGFIHPAGAEVGGHEVELHGVDVRARCVIGTNSWGAGWGVRGRFRLTWDDLDTLLAGDGDAVTLT